MPRQNDADPYAPLQGNIKVTTEDISYIKRVKLSIEVEGQEFIDALRRDLETILHETNPRIRYSTTFYTIMDRMRTQLIKK